MSDPGDRKHPLGRRSFGVRVVEAFNDKYAFTDPNNVIADGGTLGMYLYDRICRAEKLLIFDCCDFKGKPGELRVLRNDDVKLWTATKISPHQTGMNDLLVAAAVRGAIPNDIAVVGFQPVLLDDYGGSLSAEAKGKVDEAVRDGYEIVRGWNVGLRVRSEDEMAPALMDAPCLNIDQYEAGVPRQKKLQRRRYPFCALCRKGRQIMCIGIPMKVESLPYPARAVCSGRANRKPRRLMLGDVQIGEWFWLGTEWERKKLQKNGLVRSMQRSMHWKQHERSDT
mgnify:CR=1 FL=1